MWITIDIGETTGYALWENDLLVDSNQEEMWSFIDHLEAEITNGSVTAIVIEDFKIYPWKAEALIWDSVRTARGLGAIELLARQHNLPIVLQPAKIKEVAVALGAENFFTTPLHENRHANDAIMHGVYYLGMNNNVAPGYSGESVAQ